MGFWPWRCCGVGTRLPSSYSSKSDGTEYLWRRRIIVLVHTLATIGLLSLDRFKREQGGAGAQVGPTIRPVASWGEATFGTRWLSFCVRMDNDGSRMILDISRRNCQRPRFKFQTHTHTHTDNEPSDLLFLFLCPRQPFAFLMPSVASCYCSPTDWRF